MEIKLIVEGGNMKPGPAVAQQIGPLGINIGKVISDVNEKTAGFKGTKVPITLVVNIKTKEYTIKVFSPPVSELIKKELKIEAGSGESGSTVVGNMAFENVVGIARTKMPNLLAKDLRAAVRLVVGTCVSLGCLIDSKSPKEIEIEIESGNYDKEINDEITEASAEKKKKLDEYFSGIKDKQDKVKKEKEAEKALEEAKKTEEATVTEGEKTEEKKDDNKEEKKDEK